MSDVVDSGFFASIGAVNPALTIIASAVRIGEGLSGRLARTSGTPDG